MVKTRKTKTKKTRSTKAKAETKSVVPQLYVERYGKEGHCGDETAKRFAKLLKDSEDVAATVKAIAQKNAVWKAGYGQLNGGLVRMTVSNRLRRAGEEGTGDQVDGLTRPPFTRPLERPEVRASGRAISGAGRGTLPHRPLARSAAIP